MNINIDIVGAGIWFELHLEAIKCNNAERKRRFIAKITEMRETFFCDKCRQHLDLFCRKFPIQKRLIVYDKEGNDVSFFRWTWLLHNHVNYRLGKDIICFEDALETFKNIIDSKSVCGVCKMN